MPKASWLPSSHSPLTDTTWCCAAEACITKMLKTVMVAMGADGSRAEDGELARGKVAPPEDWLTDKVVRGCL